MRMRDDLKGVGGPGRPCARRAAEAEARWIYKQSIYPARDPERLASAMVIYTDTQPSFTLYPPPPPLSLHSPWRVSVRGP